MCIAIYKPEGLHLTEETIKQSWIHNSDGAGFMYHEDGQLNVVKGLMTLADFKEAYEPHKSKECVLHFRIKTHGNKDADNTHPFLIDGNLGVVHNGIISNVDTTSDTTKSDTWHFTDFYLQRFRQDNPKFFLNPVYKDMIEGYIGFSKLIFMDGEGNVEIFNEAKGLWDAGCWFSNTSYKPYIPFTQQTTNTTPKKKPDNPWSQIQRGDIVKTLQEVPCMNPREGNIPKDSYCDVLYFKQNNTFVIEEFITGFKAEVTLPQVELVTGLFNIGETQYEV